MLATVILTVFAVIALILILLAVVVVGIRLEPRDRELSSVAPGPIAAVARRLLGVCVRRPDMTADSTEPRDECLLDTRSGQRR